VHGVFVTGSQGEFWAFSEAEKTTHLGNCCRRNQPACPGLRRFSCGNNREAVKLTRLAEKVGIDAVSVLTP